MHVSRRLALTATGAALAAVALAACSSNDPDPLIPKVPANITVVQNSSANARALTRLGYLPIYELTQPKQGYVWAVCPKVGGAVTNLTACSRDVNRKGADGTPNVFMFDGDIVYLQVYQRYVRHTNSGTVQATSEMVYITVPAKYQKAFGSLTVTQQRQFLSLAGTAQRHAHHDPPLGSNSMSLDLTFIGEQLHFSVLIGYHWPQDVH
jgi:hypothetical protein